MQRARLLISHPLTGSGMRFGIAGAIVAVVYLGVPIGLNGAAGVPIEVAIPIAYVLAMCLHFTLQRNFVFRHVAEFALSRRKQVNRYFVIAIFQYPTTAAATAVLPSVLDLSPRATFLVVSLTTSLITFIVLRTLIFHGHRGLPEPPATSPATSVGNRQVREEQFLG